MNRIYNNLINITSLRFMIFITIVISMYGCGGGADRNDIPVVSVNNSPGSVNNPPSTIVTPGSIVSTSVVTDGSISWEFSSSVQTGKFANGQYWVVGPMTIVEVTPSYNGRNNGFEVNPVNTISQGFDDRIRNFDSSLVPSLPFIAQPGQSLIKVVSVNASISCPYQSCIQSASVLTVLSSPPPNNGANVFRPPYFGNDKTLYLTDDINFSLLPNYAPTESALTFEQVASQYRNVQLDHKISWTGRSMHPIDSMPDYGSSIAKKNTEAALTLMLQGTNIEKNQAVINHVNNGIDIYHMMKGGVIWRADGGHGGGRKLPAIMAAVLLENTTMKDDLTNVNPSTFGETSGVYYSAIADNGNGKVLWGQQTMSERKYWEMLVLDNTSRTIKDPYGQIDGGQLNSLGHHSYQYCCTSLGWDNIVTALELMPSLRTVFNFPILKTYTDRWMTTGYYSQPDDCAPTTGVENFATDYGVVFGPDGNGGCIKDLNSGDGFGRLPQLHATTAGQGYYGSNFAAEMKAAYLP